MYEYYQMKKRRLIQVAVMHINILLLATLM